MDDLLIPELVVITGPMWSGKSEELIRQLQHASIAQIPLRVFKPADDTRVAHPEIRSRSGQSLPAIDIRDPLDMFAHVDKEAYGWIGIDEAHFFHESLVAVVQQLLAWNKRVVVAGLDLDFRGHPFGTIASLLALAQHVQKLTAVCSACRRRRACRSQRLTDDPRTFLVGDTVEYAPRCLSCFHPPVH